MVNIWYYLSPEETLADFYHIFVTSLAYFVKTGSNIKKKSTKRYCCIFLAIITTVCIAILTCFDGLIGTYDKVFLHGQLFCNAIMNNLWKTALCYEKDQEFNNKIAEWRDFCPNILYSSVYQNISTFFSQWHGTKYIYDFYKIKCIMLMYSPLYTLSYSCSCASKAKFVFSSLLLCEQDSAQVTLKLDR